MNKMLLISSSKFRGGGYLDHYDQIIPDFFHGIKEVVFLPYSAHPNNWESYTKTVKDRFAKWGIDIINAQNVHLALGLKNKSIPAIFIGGGNTFRLLKNLQDLGLIEAIKDSFTEGKFTHYMGASAGSNVAGWSIKTTNDMPIVYPTQGLDGIRLVDIQINPHYFDPDQNSLHMGETRPQRIAEFHEENEIPVIGLREGSYLLIDKEKHTKSDRMFLGGENTGAKFFFKSREPIDICYPCEIKLTDEDLVISIL